MAMTKDAYGIPTSIDRKPWDVEIDLSDGRIAAARISLKQVAFYLVGVLFIFWLVFATYLKASSFMWHVALVFVLGACVIYLGNYSKTKELRVQRVSDVPGYLPTKMRRVITRRSVSPDTFYSVVGIRDVDENGLIVWSNGDLGQIYRVVGSASALLFQEDQHAILRRVDTFYRNLGRELTMTIITTKEPHRVWRPLGHLSRLHANVQFRDPELLGLLNQKATVLKDFVGQDYSSIHQYLILRASNIENLQQGHNLLVNEASISSYVFRELEAVNTRQGVYEVFGPIYSNR